MPGKPGPGGTGDGIVTITVKDHPFFERDGANIRLDLPVTLDEAVKGAKVKVPTVDGPVMLSIPAGSTSGKVMRRILRKVAEGDTVEDGQTLCILEAMKMQNPIPADGRAVVARVAVKPGDVVAGGDLLVELDDAPEAEEGAES